MLSRYKDFDSISSQVEGTLFNATTLPTAIVSALKDAFSNADKKLQESLNNARKEYHSNLAGKDDESSEEKEASHLVGSIKEEKAEELKLKIDEVVPTDEKGQKKEEEEKKVEKKAKALTQEKKAEIDGKYEMARNNACNVFNESMHEFVKGLATELVKHHPVAKTPDMKGKSHFMDRDSEDFTLEHKKPIKGKKYSSILVDFDTLEDYTSKSKIESKKHPSSLFTVEQLLKSRKKADIFELAEHLRDTDSLTDNDYKRLYAKNAEKLMGFEGEDEFKIVKKKESKNQNRWVKKRELVSKDKDKEEWKEVDVEVEEWKEVEVEEQVSLVPDWINKKLTDLKTVTHKKALLNHSTNIPKYSKSMHEALAMYSSQIARNIEDGHKLENTEQKSQIPYKSLYFILVAAIVQVAALKFNASINLYTSMNVLRASYAFTTAAVGIGVLAVCRYETKAGFETTKKAKIEENGEKQVAAFAAMYNKLTATMLLTRNDLDLMIDAFPANVVKKELLEISSRVIGDGKVNEIISKAFEEYQEKDISF